MSEVFEFDNLAWSEFLEGRLALRFVTSETDPEVFERLNDLLVEKNFRWDSGQLLSDVPFSTFSEAVTEGFVTTNNTPWLRLRVYTEVESVPLKYGIVELDGMICLPETQIDADAFRQVLDADFV